MKGFALRTALVLTAFVAFLELAGGIVAGSLALLADSAHVFMDAFALGIAVAASAQAGRPATGRRTFGFARLEVLAALGNGGLLLAVAVLIAVEAVRRFGAPGLPQGGTMAIVAGIGFVVNVGIGLTLRHSARDNINV
ncbi:MAG: cation transporter [Candidatus Eremiobacteraeota bacterium]|nr:cation transporter [Candidatus Eremiobacteraeota bacterium]